MSVKCFSAAVAGIDAVPVEVEVKISAANLPAMKESMITIVGLPDAAVKESRERITAAFSSSKFALPPGMAVVNLAPADLRKEGASFDLAIALCLLAEAGVVDKERIRTFGFAGELALDGSVRAVKGALPLTDVLGRSGKVNAVVVPLGNACEAALAAGKKFPVFGIASLQEAVDLVNNGDFLPCRAELKEFQEEEEKLMPDFAEVKGQQMAKRALEIAAAGGHNILMCGPPGTGKSMLASRLPGILPPMTLEETLETSRIHSVLGMLSSGTPILTRRPFTAPHHTVSDAGLLGGGHDPRPGEISLAHNGVLFLDELPEFKRNVLEVLRQPLETGSVTISRASGSCTFPARFILCAAMNPCPCGRGEVELGCVCKLEEKRRYLKKLSGPLLDRIDLHVEVRQLSQDELVNVPAGESSAVIRQRVIAARKIQEERFARHKGIYCNARMGSRELQLYCALTPGSEALLRQAINRFKLSPRAYDRILKVARTIADLAGVPEIPESAIFEAINYRKAGF